MSRHRSAWPAIAVLALFAAATQAHPLDAAALAGPGTWPMVWTFEPWVVGCLLVSALLYALGLARLWRQAGVNHGVRKREAVAFATGWLALAVALVSPLDALGTLLFSAHMLQHELLMVVAAPLLCLGRPLAAWTWALRPALRRAVGRGTRHPAWRRPWRALTAAPSTWALHAIALWGWHVPTLFDAALRDTGIHTLQHLSFLGSALLFWWSALAPLRSPHAAGRAAQGGALLYVFTTMLHTAALGALLTLAPVVWYAPYQATSLTLGLEPLADQQLGGLVMWVPAGLAYLVAGLLLAARWLNARPSVLPRGARAIRRSTGTPIADSSPSALQ